MSTEKFVINFIEKDLIKVELSSVDIVNSAGAEGNLDNWIPTEVPSKSDAKTFRTAYDYNSSSLVVYFNGIKLLSSDYTILSSRNFELSIDTIDTDTIEVAYKKK